MAKFRAETVDDLATGKVFFEVYFPEDAAEPFIRTTPVYGSHEEAAAAVMEKMRREFPSHPITKANWESPSN